MSGKTNRAADYLGHIVEAIHRIQRYTDGMGEHAFLSSELIQDAVIRNFEVIGEASRNIERNCPEFLATYRDLPLVNAYEMRNALAHGYFRVDLEIVWHTIRGDLPVLRQQIEAILEELARGRQ